MRRGDRGSGRRPSGLHGDDGHALIVSPARHRGEVLRIAHGFEEQPDDGDSSVVEEGVDAILDAHAGLVADGDDRAQAEAALLEREVDRDVATLRHDGDTTIENLHAVLVGPQRDTIEGVDKAVAVRPEERQIAGCVEQIPLQVGVACLGKARPVAHRTTGTDRPQRRHRLDGRVPVDTEEHRVGHLGKIVERR